MTRHWLASASVSTGRKSAALNRTVMEVISSGCKKKASRREDGKPHGDAEGSVRDRLAARKALQADEAPGAVVDQPLQRLAQRVEEHFIDPLDQFAVAAQFHR